MTWKTDTADFAAAVAEFEAALPGFWWSVGQCSVGAHASCAVDGGGVQAHLLDGVKAGEPLDDGFHVDTDKGTPAEALRDVMRQALTYLTARNISSNPVLLSRLKAAADAFGAMSPEQQRAILEVQKKQWAESAPGDLRSST